MYKPRGEQEGGAAEELREAGVPWKAAWGHVHSFTKGLPSTSDAPWDFLIQ